MCDLGNSDLSEGNEAAVGARDEPEYSSSRGVHGHADPDVPCSAVQRLSVPGLQYRDVQGQAEPGLGAEATSRLWRIARRQVGKKWDILKVCSSVLNENVGWETCERESSLRKDYYGRLKI